METRDTGSAEGTRRYPPSVYAAAREGFRWTFEGIRSRRIPYPDSFALGAIMAEAKCGLQPRRRDARRASQDRLAWIAGAAAASLAVRRSLPAASP